MKNVFKDNSVLLIGIILPIVMIIIFGLATVIPKYFVASPHYNLVFTTAYDPYSNNGLKIRVENGKLKAQFIYNNPVQATNNYAVKPTLYIFDVKSKTIREIYINLPVLTPDTKFFVQEINIPELNNVTIDESTIAPDGYQYNPANYNNSGLLSGLFYGARAGAPSISKNGYSIPITLDSQSSYYSVRFIGWIIPEEGK